MRDDQLMRARRIARFDRVGDLLVRDHHAGAEVGFRAGADVLGVGGPCLLVMRPQALEGTDDDAVKTAVDKLNTTSAALGQAMYAAAQAAQQAESAPSEAGQPSDNADSNGSSQSADEDVVDAEIVDDENANEANK